MKVKALNLALVVIVLFQVMVNQSVAVNYGFSNGHDHYNVMDADLEFIECPGINFQKGTKVGHGGGSRSGGSGSCRA